MIDTGKADKLQGSRQFSCKQTRRVMLHCLAEVLFVRLPKPQPKNRRPNSPSDCAPRLIPSAGEHPHKTPRLPHILTIGMLLPNAGYTLEETFRLPWCGETSHYWEIPFSNPIPKLPVRLSNNHHPTAQQ